MTDLNTEIEKTEQLIGLTRELRDKFHNDPQRPTYHFLPPSGWMNDINGAIFWNGRYHIFYQHNPEAAYWRVQCQWGHASSVDLVHWVHHPIAMVPTDGADYNGCFSGGAFVSKEGTAMFIYHGSPHGTCLAASHDDMLIGWTKHPANPVIAGPKKKGDPGHGIYMCMDPCAWVEGDTYYALIGNRVPGVIGDGTSLFKSQDLAHWEYVGPFYESDRRWTDADEDCAVPDFFPLGDKHMLLFGSHLVGTQYYLGYLEDEKFHPQTHARMTWPGGPLGGSRTLLDGDGRRICFDWMLEFRGPFDSATNRVGGWSGAMTLPRILCLADDGSLRIEPAPELEVLRMNPRRLDNLSLAADSELAIDSVRGDCLELAIEVMPEDARAFGVKVRCSPDGGEQTVVLYDAQSGNLKVDVSRATLDSEVRYETYRTEKALERLPEEARTVQVQEAPFELTPGEDLSLRLFLDRSVLEVFANGRQCITQRIYPTRPDSLGVQLFCRGGSVNVKSLQAWDMAPAHE